jgi:hypothetical protein
LLYCKTWNLHAADLKRNTFNFAAHRRPEHYRLIVERTGAEVTPSGEP